MTKKSTQQRGVLVYLSGSQSNERIKIRPDGMIFGREQADLVISDQEVSSIHFQIQRIDDNYHVFDMNSSNGTFLNGQRIVKAQLRDGDELRAGSTLFRFSLVAEESVRNIPSLYQSSKTVANTASSIVETLIDRELNSPGLVLVIDVTYGNKAHETLTLPEKSVMIGRASSFGRFDRDPEMSRKHLLIKVNESGEIFVEDQGSTNGTFLNDRKISGLHRVNETDTVRIGLCRLKLQVARASL